MTDIDLCTSGDCLSAPFSLWVALDILFVLIAAVLVVYGEVIKIIDLLILIEFTVLVFPDFLYSVIGRRMLAIYHVQCEPAFEIIF